MFLAKHLGEMGGHPIHLFLKEHEKWATTQ